MKVCAIGLGQAGGKILDAFLERDAHLGSTVVTGALAVNTAKADLMGLELVPEDKRILIGQSELKGHGAGTDNERGAEVARADMEEIMSGLDGMANHEIEAFLLFAGLGGGTGSGAMPVVAEQLQQLYTEPIYGVGILPAKEEGGIYSRNAARSFQNCVDNVDSLITFDNGAWRSSGQSVAGGYQEMNHELVLRLHTLFSAGELDAMGGDIAESVVDASEIINTLGNAGVSTIGYASEPLTREERESKGLLSRFSSSSNDTVGQDVDVNRVASLVRKAALGKLTVPVNLSSTERALVVVAGPPDSISRKGIEKARRWTEEQTDSMEVRGGDYPLNENNVAALVLFSGVTDIPRVKDLQRLAVETSEKMQELREQSEENLNNLLMDDEDAKRLSDDD